MLVGGTLVLTAGNSHLIPGGLCLLLLHPVDKHPPWTVLTAGYQVPRCVARNPGLLLVLKTWLLPAVCEPALSKYLKSLEMGPCISYGNKCFAAAPCGFGP